MKKILCIITAIICILSFTILCFAHSGRTDANGGHYVGGTSNYHYHHGYSAHQHPNGICPYGNNENNNGIDWDYHYEKAQKLDEEAYQQTTIENKDNESSLSFEKNVKSIVDKIWSFILSVCMSFCFSLFIFGVIFPLLTLPYTAITNKHVSKELLSKILFIGCIIGTVAFLFIFI